MKRNLLKGIVLISVIALSSCSTTNKLAGTANVADDDDVYYTKAQAGDKIEYADDYYQPGDNNYDGNDEYYYYGDYASRINRFDYDSPFDYDDNYYYDYSPYNNYGLDLGLGFGSPYAYGGLYSPFDYDYGLYAGIGYGGGYYPSYGYGGGWRGRYSRQHARPNYAGGSAATYRGARVAVGPLAPGGGYYPRTSTTNPRQSINSTGGNRGIRADRNDNIRPATRQTIERAPSIAPGNSNSSSGGGGGSSSGGGGGRPVRP